MHLFPLQLRGVRILFVVLSPKPPERILAVEGLSVRPRSFSLTPHGEISQTATARIVTWF